MYNGMSKISDEAKECCKHKNVLQMCQQQLKNTKQLHKELANSLTPITIKKMWSKNIGKPGGYMTWPPQIDILKKLCWPTEFAEQQNGSSFTPMELTNDKQSDRAVQSLILLPKLVNFFKNGEK
eukprot:10766627-Ditylum_brightwellii.AAC.1